MKVSGMPTRGLSRAQIRGGSFVNQRLYFIVKTHSPGVLFAQPANAHGFVSHFTRADGENDGNLSKLMFAHLVVHLFITNIGFRPQSGGGQSCHRRPHILVGFGGDRGDDNLSGSQPKR